MASSAGCFQEGQDKLDKLHKASATESPVSIAKRQCPFEAMEADHSETILQTSQDLAGLGLACSAVIEENKENVGEAKDTIPLEEHEKKVPLWVTGGKGISQKEDGSDDILETSELANTAGHNNTNVVAATETPFHGAAVGTEQSPTECSHPLWQRIEEPSVCPVCRKSNWIHAECQSCKYRVCVVCDGNRSGVFPQTRIWTSFDAYLEDRGAQLWAEFLEDMTSEDFD
ncbi:hypothetical protein AJ80_06000 [Polytolypa hystricis UAMH7299]|uniref:Uncharacterized protein n=1 Tax=Polytolypa hystricis (strain UAMH7299) TaxID=1447883 RepID=A0A2B7XZ12_POLH7|nr:hypothetical protein AJ80_06000 [Polytolypa hystricis UAMH7299]